MKLKSYRFQCIAENFSNNGLNVFLEDSYLNTTTPINLNGTASYDFTITNITGSWEPNRFRIVFKVAAVLPVTFSSVKAFPVNGKIEVVF